MDCHFRLQVILPTEGLNPGLPHCSPFYIWTSLVAQRLMRVPAMQEIQAQTLGQEDPLEKEMAIHSSTLAWRMPWTEEPDELQSMGSQRVRHK